MNGLARVLEGGDPENVHFARLRVHLDINDAARGRAPYPLGINGGTTHYGATGVVQPARQVFEANFELRIGNRPKLAVLELDGLGVHVPDLRRTVYHLALYVLGRLVGSPPRGEGGTTSRRKSGETYQIRIHHRRVHILSPEAQNLGSLHGDGSPGPSNIGIALYQVYRTIFGDANGAARRKANVEPETHSHTTSTTWTFQWSLPVGMVPDGLHHLNDAYTPVDRSIGAAGALFGGVV